MIRFCVLVGLVCLFSPASIAEDSADDLAGKAARALESGDLSTAKDLFLRATVEKPDFAEAWVGLGLSLWRQGEEELAQQSFEMALKWHEFRFRKHPSDWNQLFQQVAVLLLLNREDEALHRLREGQTRFPDVEAFQVDEATVRGMKAMLDGE